MKSGSPDFAGCLIRKAAKRHIKIPVNYLRNDDALTEFMFDKCYILVVAGLMP
jgi:hypothetical protein